MQIPSDGNFTRSSQNSGNSGGSRHPAGGLGTFRIPRERRPSIQIWRILHKWSGCTLSAHTTRVGLRGMRQAANLAEPPKYFTNTGVRSRKNKISPRKNMRRPSEANFTRNPGNSGNSENLDNPQAVLEVFRISRDRYPTIQI